MSLEAEYRELIKTKNFLKTFPDFTGEWDRDKGLFEKMSGEDQDWLNQDIEISDEEDDLESLDEYWTFIQ